MPRSLVSSITLACMLAAVLFATPAGGAKTERYVALGDSYSSGTGTGDSSGGPICDRSRYAYPALVAARHARLKLVFAACSGAATSDVLSAQVSRLSEQTRWVTITIGGNDVGFVEVIGTCAQGSAGECGAAIDRARKRIRDDLPGRLDDVYREISRRAPDATVIVLGYPRLFAQTGCRAAASFSQGAAARVNDTAALLRDTLRRRVKAAGEGFRFTDTIGPFAGHEICSARPWLNGMTSPITDSFHPNRAGHSRGYAPLVLRAMG